MPRAYTKVEILSEEVFRRKKAGETNRAIAESYGLTLKQIKKLITRQNPADEETRRNNELVELRMQVELLRNFLSEAGRR